MFFVFHPRNDVATSQLTVKSIKFNTFTHSSSVVSLSVDWIFIELSVGWQLKRLINNGGGRLADCLAAWVTTNNWATTTLPSPRQTQRNHGIRQPLSLSDQPPDRNSGLAQKTFYLYIFESCNWKQKYIFKILSLLLNKKTTKYILDRSKLNLWGFVLKQMKFWILQNWCAMTASVIPLFTDHYHGRIGYVYTC